MLDDRWWECSRRGVLVVTRRPLPVIEGVLMLYGGWLVSGC